MKSVTMLVRLTVPVPDGVEPGDLCLDLPEEGDLVVTDAGRVVSGAVIEEYCTVSAEETVGET